MSQKTSVNTLARSKKPRASTVIAEAANFSAAAKLSRVSAPKASTSKAGEKAQTKSRTKSKVRKKTKAKTKSKAKTKTQARTKTKAKKTKESKADANTKATPKANSETKADTKAEANTNANTDASVATEKVFSKDAPERDKFTLSIGGKSVAISHPRRIYYPELKLSKMDVIDYYRTVSSYLLPYLKDRPFVLHRFPGGIYHDGFYQKDNEQEMPGWVQTTEIHTESTNEDVKYIVCQNEATLVYLANLGCLEMNPWNSRIRHIDKPDWMIFDLDAVDIGFTKVVEVAQVLHGMFEASGIPHYCKTSGKRGLHVAIPLGAKYANDTVREMAASIAQLVHQELPRSTSLERSPAKRQKKIYLDYLQNGFGKTLIAPYSLRPVDYAGVSTPLRWEEVDSKLDPRDFNIHTIMARIKDKGDLWQGLITETIDLKALLNSWLNSNAA